MVMADVLFGPCCFCGNEIKEEGNDPCQVTVETDSGKRQVWFCHGDFFKALLTDIPEAGPDFFTPAHF